MKHVQVLLSAYNGEKYLPQQLDSILAQEGVRVSLLIRDDASFDSTPRILAAYAEKFENIFVYTGKRKGAAGSFFDLLAKTDVLADYYAFADQDDVWYMDKLVRAVQKLEREQTAMQEKPLLYAGKVVCASADLRQQEQFAYQVLRPASFGNALMENICMGCTEVFNRSLLLLVRKHLPQGNGENVMHDWWMYLTASYFGKVIFDQNVYMLYRQHGNNAVGMQSCWRKRWKNRLLHMQQMKRKRSFQAEVFQGAYNGLPALCKEDKKLLDRFLIYRDSFWKRVWLATDSGIYRQNRVDDIVCRLLLILGFL